MLLRCRTGLTALTVSLWFFVSLFFGPVLCKGPRPPLNVYQAVSLSVPSVAAVE